MSEHENDLEITPEELREILGDPKEAAAEIVKDIKVFIKKEALASGRERREVAADILWPLVHANELWRKKQIEDKFGTMPEDYDPAKDPSHPSNGFKA